MSLVVGNILKLKNKAKYKNNEEKVIVKQNGTSSHHGKVR